MVTTNDAHEHDQYEVIRLETILQCAAAVAFRTSKLSASVCHFPSGKDYGAMIAMSESFQGIGTTRFEAVCDLRDSLRTQLVRKRDEYNAAIALLDSE